VLSKRRRFQSLRFRLTALHTGIVGVVLASVGTVVLVATEQDQRARLDEHLEDRTEIYAAERVAVVKAGNVHASERCESPAPTFVPRFPGYFLQLRSADGTVLQRSESLGDLTLPFTDAASLSRDSFSPTFETIPSEAMGPGAPPRGSIRVLTVFNDALEADPFYVQIGVLMDSMEHSIGSLRRVVVIAVLVALLLVGFVSWLLVGRSLASVARVARAIDEFRPHDLMARFDAPATNDEIGEMVVRINLMLDRLSQSFLSQERFIVDAAHELKTPLAVLLGEAQVLMQQGRTPEEHARFVANVQDEVRQLAQTVDSLLTLARADAGLPPTAVTAVSINDIVMEAIERCNPTATRREVRLAATLAVPSATGYVPMVLGDAGLLLVLVGNLVRNAIRYSQPLKAVHVSVGVFDESCTVSVRDYGPGIPPAFLDRVFDQFFRVPNAESSVKGIGLGLTIVRGVARVHGGSVEVVNEVEGGCCFTVRLPLAPASTTSAV